MQANITHQELTFCLIGILIATKCARLSHEDTWQLCQDLPVTSLCLQLYFSTFVQVFKVLGSEGINVKMMSQGASKTNISLVVGEEEAKPAIMALHQEFFRC